LIIADEMKVLYGYYDTKKEGGGIGEVDTSGYMQIDESSSIGDMGNLFSKRR
jgi:hypothetical protein